mmetsp:Transcript_108602/g.187838  ORF Transcript_108602/g.187838 Transcript_108602/m.187838 type:complete len:210 (-) Transcript_108602:5788-6417(-)
MVQPPTVRAPAKGMAQVPPLLEHMVARPTTRALPTQVPRVDMDRLLPPAVPPAAPSSHMPVVGPPRHSRLLGTAADMVQLHLPQVAMHLSKAVLVGMAALEGTAVRSSKEVTAKAACMGLSRPTVSPAARAMVPPARPPLVMVLALPVLWASPVRLALVSPLTTAARLKLVAQARQVQDPRTTAARRSLQLKLQACMAPSPSSPPCSPT